MNAGGVKPRETMFVAPRMVPYFHAVWGVRRSEEHGRLSKDARAVLKVLRREWEMSTSDLRDDSGVVDRKALTRDEGLNAPEE